MMPTQTDEQDFECEITKDDGASGGSNFLQKDTGSDFLQKDTGSDFLQKDT